MTNAERKWNPEKYQWEDVVEATPQPTATIETAPSPITTEPTIEEHASMLRQGFEKLVNKAVDASKLAERVKELEAKVKELEVSLVEADEIQHAQIKEILGLSDTVRNLKIDLDRRESTVHDLVMERDIALGERNAAQGERDDARNEVKRLQSDVDFLNQRVHAEAHANEVLNERSEMLTRKIATIKAAFAALNE